jgi:hypothetical protein
MPLDLRVTLGNDALVVPGLEGVEIGRQADTPRSSIALKYPPVPARATSPCQ